MTANQAVPYLSAQEISKSYKGHQALKCAEVAIYENTVTALLGKNGAGKSTFLRILAGVEPADMGNLKVESSPIRSRGQWRAYKRRLGWLPQNFGYSPRCSVDHFVRYVAWLKEVPKTDIAKAASIAIEQVGLSGQSKLTLGELSGGMIRRAGIAQAIVNNPNLILLDEPTVALDPEQREDFHALIQELAKSSSVLISTHLLEDVEACADRIVMLDRGNTVYSESIAAFRELGSEGSAMDSLRSAFRKISKLK